MADYGIVDEVFPTSRSARTVSASGALVSRQKGSSVEQAKKNFEKALAMFAEVMAQQNRFGGQQPPKGTVLRWRKSFDEELTGELQFFPSPDGTGKMQFTSPAAKEYVYVAFRAADGNWYSTSQRGTAKHKWEDLLELIGESPCEIVSGWTEVPAAEKLTDEATDPAAWASLMFGRKDETKPTVVDQKD
ncbi:MAG: hypothetical protein WC054_00090 [Candidatus Nanopelagicales bacterium]